MKTSPSARTGGSRIDGDVSVVDPNSDRADADAACDRANVDCCILRPIVVDGLNDADGPSTENTANK